MFDTIIGFIVAVRKGKIRFTLNGDLQLFNPTQGKMHTVTLTGQEDAETTKIGNGEE